MNGLINLSEIRSKQYGRNAWNVPSNYQCLICGNDIEKIEKTFSEMATEDIRNGLKHWSDRTAKYEKENYLHMDTDGNLYFADEDVAEGHESQGCFPVGSYCMKKYRQLRVSMK